MSPANAAICRLRQLARTIFRRNTMTCAQRSDYPASLHAHATQPLIEQLEPRLMLSTVNWVAGTDVPVGQTPWDVTIADINGDQKADILSANYVDDTISILFGQGGGSFGNEVTLTAETEPTEIVVGDFDGNTHMDIAVSNHFGRAAVVFYQQPDASFTRTVLEPTLNAYSDGLVAGDFNGDTRLDLAVACRNTDAVTILYGQPDGSLGGATDLTAGDDPHAIAAGDFNGDTRLDLAVVNTADDDVSIHYGLAEGGFGGREDITVGNVPIAIALGDFNGDDLLDLAVADQWFGDVSVAYGLQAGGFSEVTTVDTNSAKDLVSGDFDGDGIDDLGVANQTDTNLTVLYGQSGGGFVQENLAVGVNQGGIGAGDLDGEGRLDLGATSGGEDGIVHQLYGRAVEPNLIVHETTPLTLTAKPGQSVSIDITTKNDSDVVAAPTGSTTFETKLFLSGDLNVTTDDTHVASGSATFTTLAADASRVDTFTFNAPTQPGTYNLRALADGDTQVTESDEEDNWGHSITLTVLSDIDRYDRDHAQNLGAIGNAQKKVAGWIGRTTGNIDHNDWFKFTVTGRRKITATLTGLSRNANLQLTDALGRVLKTSTAKGTANEKVTLALVGDFHTTDTYYLRVYSNSTVKTRYALSVKAVNDIEKNGWRRAMDMGTLITRARTVNDRLGGVDTYDWYKFKVKGTRKVTLRLNGMNNGSQVDLRLYGTTKGTPNDKTITSVQLDATGPGSAVVINKVLKPGTYYAQVFTEYATVSPYRLRMSCKGDADFATRTKAKNVGTIAATTRSFDGQMGGEDRNDWFKFTTKGNFRRRVTVTLRNVGNLDIRLYDAKGRLMNTSATLGDSNEEIARNLKAGTYYVRVQVGAKTDLDDLLPYTLDLTAPRV